MNIIVLDGYTLNPGDLSWAPLEALGPLTVYDRTGPEEVWERCRDARIVLTNKAKITGEAIRRLPELQYIGELATGYDNIDVQAAREKGIPVANVPGYSTASVVQLTWAFILAATYHIDNRSQEVRAGAWSRQPDFCFGHRSLFELAGKTLGIVGLGQIGQAVARVALSFGMHVLAVDHHPEEHAMDGVVFTDRETCFREADFLSLHCPLREANREMVNTTLLSIMKPTAWLINTSRGGLIHEEDLAQALHAQQIAGAALDVLSAEPPPEAHPLLTAPHCLVTPHIGWATREARERLLRVAVENIRAFLAGAPQNVVNRP